jgi:hypothetical protein
MTSSTTGTAIRALSALCLDDFRTGEWDEALRLADVGLGMCESHGYQEIRWPLWVVRATIAAVRGDADEALELADRIADWGSRRGSTAVRLYALHVRRLLAQAADDFEQGFQCLAELAAPSTFAANLPLAVATSVDLVECAVRTDRPSTARAYVALLRSAEARSPRKRLLVGGATALACPGDSAGFEKALALPGIDNLPYDRARVQLAYAERLRRTGSLKAARDQLTEAHATFVHLRARPWLARAERELRGTGHLRAQDVHALTPRSRRSPSWPPRD